MSCLDDLTIQDFKDLFFRDFTYLPTWDVTATYNTGNEIFYAVNQLFYKCLNDGVTSVPTGVADWTLFADDKLNYILDEDITKAIAEAKLSFNEALVNGDCDAVKHVFMYLVAHYLVQDIKASGAGLSSSGDFTVASRSVGSVSESYAIPEAYLKSATLNYYTKTSYGLKYLNLVYPNTRGNIFVVGGCTLP
tara:strand:- start:2150 stop:2725 length:576 start_codon:yes stop_codon:yes gene_type:complete